jgi:hypothetical protein
LEDPANAGYALWPSVGTLRNDMGAYGGGNADLSTDVTDNENIPKEFALLQNYPNPFNPKTTIEYHLSLKSYVSIHIYNLLGQKIVTLLDEDRDAGIHKINWDGKDSHNRNVCSGIYIYRIKAKQFHKSKKMVLVR